MTPTKGVGLVRQLCAQLSGDAESFHGNIWPGNVRLDWDGRAILGEASDAPVSDRGADQVEYVAPEFFWDGIGGAAADVYSLGMLLYAICDKGYLPFQPKGGALTDKDRSGALRKRMKGEPIDLPSGISDLLGEVIQKALAYEPESRYISAAQLLEALNETDEALPDEQDEAPEAAAAAVTAGAVVAEGEAVAQEEAQPVEEEAEAAQEEPAAQEPETPVAEEAAQELWEEPEELILEETSEVAPEGEPDQTQPETAAIDEDEFWNTAEPEDTAAEPAAQETQDDSPRYTVQKDFEKKKRAQKAASAAPASARKKKKKKTSPWIPVLCVLAVAIIAGAVYMMMSGGIQDSASQNEEPQEVSDPYIVVAAETPEPTEAPQPTEEPETEDEDEAETEDGEEPQDEEAAPVGSATIDDYTVTAASDTVYVTGSGVNLRSGPSTTYGIEKTLSRGVALQRTGTVNGWSQVQYEGEEYYVSSTLVSTTAPSGTDSTSSTTSTSTGTTTTGTTGSTTTTNTGTTTNTATGTGTSTSTSTSTGTGSSTTTTTTASTTVTATRDVVVVTKNESYLRSGPDTSYTHVATLNQNDVLQRTGTVNGWSRVVYQGQELYIHDSLIETQSATTVTTAVGTLKVSSDVNVRSGAGTDSNVLGVAKTGDSLTITGLVDGKWYRVSYDGQEGYVNRNYIKVSSFALVADKSGTATVKTRANVRSGPSTDYEILGVAEVDETLTITGLTDSNWYQVSYNDQVGYIAANLVTVS
jgi:uncharacterized protein YgiM (DUF1202 family)